MNEADLDRLREMSKEPERQAMSRGVQFPSLAHQHLADEQEIMRLRHGLAEAVFEIDRRGNALRWLRRYESEILSPQDEKGWVKEKVDEVLA